MRLTYAGQLPEHLLAAIIEGAVQVRRESERLRGQT
jgi:hypothetical protein